jgi:hypothetical protein
VRLTTARTLGLWGAYLGLGLGVLYSFGGLVYDLTTTGLNLGTALAFGALVGMPLIFAVIGFTLGAVIDLVLGAARGPSARDRQDQD